MSSGNKLAAAAIAADADGGKNPAELIVAVNVIDTREGLQEIVGGYRVLGGQNTAADFILKLSIETNLIWKKTVIWIVGLCLGYNRFFVYGFLCPQLTTLLILITQLKCFKTNYKCSITIKLKPFVAWTALN